MRPVQSVPAMAMQYDGSQFPNSPRHGFSGQHTAFNGQILSENPFLQQSHGVTYNGGFQGLTVPPQVPGPSSVPSPAASPTPFSNQSSWLSNNPVQAEQPSNGYASNQIGRQTYNKLWEVEIAEMKRVHKKEHDTDVNSCDTNPGDEHTPYLTIAGSKGTVAARMAPLGAQLYRENPEEVHYIECMYVVDQFGKCVALNKLNMSNHDITQMTFDVPSWATTLKPYAFCNVTGLWEGSEVMVPLFNSMSKSLGSVNPNFWRFIIADLLRKQKKHHGQDGAFTTLSHTEKEDKHTPHISFHEDKIRVTVGDDKIKHPMKDSTNPDEVHWVTHIYVLDQDENCVGLEALDPTTADIAQVEFPIPVNATKLTPYEFCNLHGLWAGPPAVKSLDSSMGG